MLYTLLMPILAQPQIIDVSDFGVQPNTRQDATQAVARALEAAKGRKVVSASLLGSITSGAKTGQKRTSSFQTATSPTLGGWQSGLMASET